MAAFFLCTILFLLGYEKDYYLISLVIYGSVIMKNGVIKKHLLRDVFYKLKLPMKNYSLMNLEVKN